LNAWREANGTTLEESRRRFVQFVILESISSSADLALRIAFKGGNALRFVHGNMRATLDLDFTAVPDFPDDKVRIKELLDAALKRGERKHTVKARCQSVKRNPASLEKTLPTYRIKVCYQFPGDKDFQNFDELLEKKKSFSAVIEVEISLNDVLCETMSQDVGASKLRVCTLEDIIAEKLRALLQQIPRNRSRPQDVFDISSMLRSGRALDVEKVALFLVKKSEARNIYARKSAFDEYVRANAEAAYNDLEIVGGRIPFDDAWSDVLDLVSRLDIPI